MNKRLVGILILVGAIFLILIGLTVYLVQQQQDVRSNASTPSTNFNPATLANDTVTTTTPTPTTPVSATATPTTTAACAVPGTVSSVTVSYPYQDSTNHVFTDEANCIWTSVTGVDSYSVKVTNAGTGTVVSTQSVSSSVTNLVFTVQQGGTYKCDVSGVNNSCGAGPVSSGQAVCEVDGILPTGTTAPGVPTSTPVIAPPTPTPAVIQNLPKTGSTETTIGIAVVGTFLVAAGGALLFGL